MENVKITEALFRTGAFSVLAEPVILTSGHVGIYYVNTEKILQDGGLWKKYEDDSLLMIDHASNLLSHDYFHNIIDTFVKGINELGVSFDAVSGGQRRDWIFSGPVAKIMKLPHISLYKDGKIELVEEGVRNENVDLNGLEVVHFADLMTTGSSAYDPRNTPSTGWIPMLRDGGANVNYLFNVVTRLQGGEEILSQAGVEARSFVAIDEEFVQQGYDNGLININERDVTLAYMKSPENWCADYVGNGDISVFVESFNPKGKKLDRARKFLNVYKDTLKSSGNWEKLDELVHKEYNITLGDVQNVK